MKKIIVIFFLMVSSSLFGIDWRIDDIILAYRENGVKISRKCFHVKCVPAFGKNYLFITCEKHLIAIPVIKSDPKSGMDKMIVCREK